MPRYLTPRRKQRRAGVSLPFQFGPPPRPKPPPPPKTAPVVRTYTTRQRDPILGVLRTRQKVQALSPRQGLPPRRPAQTAPAKGKVQAGKKAPIKAPVRPSRGTASTLPRHASTPAVKSHSIADRTPAAKARALPRPRVTRAPVRTAQQVYDHGIGPDGIDVGMSDQDLVDQQLAPLYMENDQAFEREQEFERQRAAMIQSLTGELMGKLGTIAPQVAQDYNNFIATNTSLAQEAQQALAASSTNPQTQADLSAINAPQEQKDQLAEQAQQVFQGGGSVLFTRQGLVPGQQLAGQGAAATAYARTLPGIAGLQGAQAMRQFLAQSAETQQSLLDQRRLIAAKAPGILQEIMSSRASEAAKQRALDLEEAALRRQLGNDRFDRAVTKTKLGFEQTRLTQNQKRINLEALQQDRNWQATLKRLQISSAAEKRKASELEMKARSGGFTPSQLAKMKGVAYTIADHAFHGFTETNSKGETVATHRPLTYGEAIREMLKEGIPLRLAQPALNFYYRPNRPKPKSPPAGSLFGAQFP